MSLAVVMLSRGRDLPFMRKSLPLLDRHLLGPNKVGLTILHEAGDFTADEMSEIEALCPGVGYREISLEPPEGTDPDTFEISVDRFSVKYRSMCRLFGYRIFDLFSDYDYVCRVDSDSWFWGPVVDIEAMMDSGIDYMHRGWWRESPEMVVGLWPFMQRVTGAMIPNPGRAVCYNNFYVASVAAWSSPQMREVYAALELSGHIYTRRWGDAPIHTLLCSAMFRYSTKVNTSFTYGHSTKYSIAGSSHFVGCPGLRKWIHGGFLPVELQPHVE